MRKFLTSHFLSLFMVPGLLLSHIPLAAIEAITSNVSDQQDTFNYIYLGKELSNVSDIVSKVSALDEDQDSIIHAMKNYMNDGFLVAGYDEVMEALQHAQYVVERSINKAGRDTSKNQLHLEISQLIQQILDGSLSIDEDLLEQGAFLKGSCPSLPKNDCQDCCLPLVIKNDLQVCGDAVFKGNVKIKQDLKVGDDLKVKGNAVFNEDVRIKGSLTANDVVISDLVVTDLSVVSCIDSLCVLNLSAVDAVISNLTITATSLDSVSITDAVITNLTVLSCMDSLCVNNLSVSDISISGTLSVDDVVISDSLTLSGLTTPGVIHNNASGLLSSSLIVNADVAAGAAIVDTKLATIVTAGKVANSATTATSTNTPNTIVLRDGAGNFAAGTITAALNGNATTATTAVSFSGPLAGEVTGTQAATVVTNAVATNTANAIVRRTATGGFSAGAVSMTDGVMSTSLRVTPFVTAGVVHNSAAGLFSSSLIVNADVSATAAIVDTKLATIATAGKVANSATTATAANTANAIVARTATGGFSAGAVSLTDGVATSSLTVTPFVTAGIVHNNAAGLLSSSLIVNADVAAGAAIVDTKLATIATAGKVANSATTATAANTANAIVARTATGGFSAGVVSVTDAVATGNIDFTGVTSTATTGNIMKGANTFIHNFGTENTFVGQSAGNFTTTGIGGNTAVGISTLAANTTGEQNTAVGRTAMLSNTAGDANTAIGFRSMEANTTGTANTAVGQGSLLVNTIGGLNVAIGAHALESNITGNLNVGIGFNGLNLCTGIENTCIGCNSLENLTSGARNTAIGRFAGQNCSGGSSDNIYINNLGAAESGTIRIGGANQTTCYIGGIYGNDPIVSGQSVYVGPTGQLGSPSSSRKFKHDIEDMVDESAAVLDLRPVTFVYNEDETHAKQYGLIAEEVEEVFPALGIYGKDGVVKSVRYEVLPILLLNEMKKQQAEINELKDLKSVVAQLQADLYNFVATHTAQ